MRIFFFFFAFVCLPFVCYALAKDKGFFMEMNIGYAHTDYHDDSYMLLSPRIGYQFNDRWAAGVKYIGETDNYLQYHTLGGICSILFLAESPLEGFCRRWSYLWNADRQSLWRRV